MVPSLGLLSDSFGYSTTGATGSSLTIPKTTNRDLVRVAADLSSDASAIVTIGGTASEILTYSATDILNSLASAGTVLEPPAIPPLNSNTQSVLQQAINQAIVDAFNPQPASAGLYTPSGSLQGLPYSDLSTNWATVLQSNPELASTVIANSLAQGITRTLIATA